jgi:ribosome-associated protein
MHLEYFTRKSHDLWLGKRGYGNMAIRLSRTEQKRRVKEVEKLVKELVELPVQQLSKLPCDNEIAGLFTDVASLKGGARKRQIKYITKILKNEPLEDLYTFVTQRKGARLRENKQFHELEYLRESLLDEAINDRKVLRSEQQELSETWSSETVAEIKKIFPLVDGVALQRLSAIFARTRQSRHSREIFRILQAAQEQATRSQNVTTQGEKQ